MDPQRAAGRCLGVPLASPAASIYKVLLGDSEPRFEFILIDCLPDLDVLSANALMAATHVIIPVEHEPLSLFTLEDVLLFVRDVRGLSATSTSIHACR